LNVIEKRTDVLVLQNMAFKQAVKIVQESHIDQLIYIVHCNIQAIYIYIVFLSQ
jgi:hypothetical protein